MSWQEELRRLDEELAAGQISADDYRLRRDGVLSAAVNADPQAAPAPSGQAESTQIIAPVNAPQSGPTPAQPGGATSADQTQIVNSNFGDGERTQAVSQGPPQGWAQGAQAGDADRTQVVPGVPPQSVAGGYRPQGQGSGGFPSQQTPQYHPPQGGQQQMPWNAPNQDTSTPWGGSEFPADNKWVAQGPEPSFEATPSKGGKKVIAIVLAVVVLAGLGVGGYFLFAGNGSDNPPVAQSSSQAPPPPTQKPKDDLEVAKLPGNVLATSNFASFDDLKATKALTDSEFAVLAEANPTKARQSVAKLPSGATAVVLTVLASDASAASNAVDGLTEQQTKFKLVKYAGTTPTGVEVMQLEKDGVALIRAHYVHKQTVVRVHVDGPDLATVSKVFDEILAKQLAELPASS